MTAFLKNALRLRIATAFLCSAVVSGCGPRTAPLRLDVRHPANPRALEGPPTTLSSRLQPDEFDRAIVDSTVSETDSAVTSPTHEEHVAPTHHHGSAAIRGGALGATRSAADSTAVTRRAPQAAVYACPMHPEVTDTTASTCPKCGMTLVRRNEKP